MKTLILLPFFLTIFGCSSINHIDNTYGIEIVSIGTKGDTRHIKFNKITGESWWSDNVIWKPIIDDTAIPESQYVVKIVSTGSSWRALRIDTSTGKTWKNSKGKWIPMSVLGALNAS